MQRILAIAALQPKTSYFSIPDSDFGYI